MSNRKRNNHNDNNHVAGRIGLVVGLAGSFSLVLIQNNGNSIGFIVTLFLALAGYMIYILLGR